MRRNQIPAGAEDIQAEREKAHGRPSKACLGDERKDEICSNNAPGSASRGNPCTFAITIGTLCLLLVTAAGYQSAIVDESNRAGGQNMQSSSASWQPGNQQAQRQGAVHRR